MARFVFEHFAGCWGYILTEVCEFSSIFALFVSSVLSGHYAMHGMSTEAQNFASDARRVERRQLKAIGWLQSCWV